MERYKNRAFMVSALALALFLMLALAVQVQVMGRARYFGVQGARKTAAALILQNAQADFAAGTGGFAEALAACENGTETAVTLRYTATGAESVAGEYMLTAALTPQAQAAGCLVKAELSVYYIMGDEQPVAALETARYLPGGEVEQ